ncbi:MAG: hypothetical protein LBU66_05760 [Treponema sp.]|jgi:hypothetical protein|nr:hypothetical protein [Treponema sp.]
MKNKILLLILIFLLFVVRLFAMGKADEPEAKTQRDEWILGITKFETSALPPERSVVAEVIKKKFVEKISSINYRARVSGEYAYYEEIDWAKARSDAAKALANKHNERALLVYRGEANWRFRRNLARIDEDIKKLWETLEKIDNNAPLINREPVFQLSKNALEYSFPSPPEAGREARFCADQRIDAFLAGSIASFHGRFIVSLRLYTVYSKSFVWEDSLIFSHEEIDDAMEEVTRRLIIALAGYEPAAVAFKTQPEDTLVLINRSFAGRGETAPQEYPPGTVTITASAPNHESLTFDTELVSGELTNIMISLSPIMYGDIELLSAGGRVYHGALYVGEPPLTLRLPVNQKDYFEIEGSNNSIGRIVVQTPDESDFTLSFSIRAAEPPKEGHVDRARRMYYWAWGSTWVAGIAAWISYQSFNASNSAAEHSYQIGKYNQGFADDNQKWFYTSMGTAIAVGVAAVFDIIFMSRYIYTANRDSTSVAR